VMDFNIDFGNSGFLRNPANCECTFVFVLNWTPRHEDVLWSGGIGARIFNLGTRWRYVFIFTTRPLYPPLPIG
jgi:hypothetical protein